VDADCTGTENVCILESCDPDIGTCFAVLCDDYNECTDDPCDPDNGCTHVPKNCDDDNVCTTESCDPVAGCSRTEVAGCTGTTTVDTVDANTVNTGTLNVGGGSKKRGLSSGTALNVIGGVTVSGPLTTTELTTTTFTTNSVTVTGSLTITTSDGSSSFDPSQGIDTKGITCTSLDVEGPSTVDSLSVTANAIIDNTLTTKDATIQDTLTAKDVKLETLKFTTDTDPWWGKTDGEVFAIADPSCTSGVRFFVKNNGVLYEIPIQTTLQYGTHGNSCYLGQCQAGLTCRDTLLGGKKCL